MARFVLWIVMLGIVPCALADIPSYIQTQYHQTIQGWLDAHPSYRLALDGDCKCNDQIKVWVEEQAPQTHPYFAWGDFDGDGSVDFAIVVLPKRPGDKILVVVFFSSNTGSAARVSEFPVPFTKYHRESLAASVSGALPVGKNSSGKPAYDYNKLVYNLNYGSVDVTGDTEPGDLFEVPLRRKSP